MLAKVYAVLLVLALLTQDSCAGRFRQSCLEKSDCERVAGSQYVCEASECQHRALFPFSNVIGSTSIIGYSLLIVLSAISNAGGAGGGAILAPIFLFNFGYTVPETGPLTKVTILAGSIVSFLMVMSKPHPKIKDEYIIDYGLSSILFPLLCAGSMVSVLLTKMLPPMLSIILPTLLLIRSAINIFGNA